MISDKKPERSVAIVAQSRLKSWYQKSLSGLRKSAFFIIAIFACPPELKAQADKSIL